MNQTVLAAIITGIFGLLGIGIPIVVAKLTTIHTLVNSNLGIQLQLTAVACRNLAEVTKKPEHIKAAAEAEELLQKHNEQQAIVDQK